MIKIYGETIEIHLSGSPPPGNKKQKATSYQTTKGLYILKFNSYVDE